MAKGGRPTFGLRLFGCLTTSRVHRVRCERGFTLVELLVVSVIFPLVLGAAAIAIITSLKNDSSVSTRLSDSHDAQITSAYFVRDVQSAAFVTTASTSPLCGTGNQVLGLAWNPSQGTSVYVSYVTASVGSPLLDRNYCNGAAQTVSKLSEGLSGASGAAQVTLTCSPSDTNCVNDASSSQIPSVDVTTVQLQVTEATGYQYDLTASPRANSTPGALVPGGGSAPTLLLLGSGTGVASCGGSGSSPFNVNGLAAVDSAAAGSITLNGSDAITAAQVYAGSSSPVQPAAAYTTTTSSAYSWGPPVPDPYADLPDPPTAGVTTYNTAPTSSETTLNPGIYTVAVTITWNVTLNPGIYVFEQGLTVQGPPGATVTGNGVLLFIGIPNASPTLAQTAAYTVAGNGVVNASAMTGGPYAGMVVFQSRSDYNTLQVSGNGTLTTSRYAGVIYAPHATVSTFGNGGTNAGGIVAQMLSCGGNGGVTLGQTSVPTSTSVTSSNNAPIPGQSVTFTATVAGSDGLTPAGTVTFSDTPHGSAVPSTMCSNVTLVNGQATCSTSALTIANSPYTITATYSAPPSTTMFASSSGTTTQSVVPTVPGAPTGLTAGAGNGQVALAWTAPVNNGGAPITSYTVLYGTSSNGPFTTINTGSSATSYTVTGLTNGTTYFFEVEAVNVAGTGPASNEVSATPFVPTAPGSPTNLSAARGNSQVALTWTAPTSNGGSPITSYTVLYSSNPSGPYTQIVTGNTATGYTVTSLNNGTVYYFEVEATNSIGTGSQSNQVSATPATVPGAPTCSSTVTIGGSGGNKTATLSWTAPANNGSPITDYLILYSQNANMSGASTFDTQSTATSGTVTGLANNKPYYFEVVAVNAVGQGPASNQVAGHT